MAIANALMFVILMVIPAVLAQPGPHPDPCNAITSCMGCSDFHPTPTTSCGWCTRYGGMCMFGNSGGPTEQGYDPYYGACENGQWVWGNGKAGPMCSEVSPNGDGSSDDGSSQALGLGLGLGLGLPIVIVLVLVAYYMGAKSRTSALSAPLAKNGHISSYQTATQAQSVV